MGGAEVGHGAQLSALHAGGEHCGLADLFFLVEDAYDEGDAGVVAVDEGMVEPDFACLQLLVVAEEVTYLGVGDQYARIARLGVHNVEAVRGGMVLVGVGVGQAGVTDNGPHRFEAGVVETECLAAVAGDGGDWVGQGPFAACVDVLHDCDEAVVVTGVVGDQPVGGGREPVQHAALLQVPGMGFGDAFELAGLHVDQAHYGGVAGGGGAIVEVRLQAEVVAAGRVPWIDGIVAEEVVLGTLGNCSCDQVSFWCAHVLPHMVGQC